MRRHWESLGDRDRHRYLQRARSAMAVERGRQLGRRALTQLSSRGLTTAAQVAVLCISYCHSPICTCILAQMAELIVYLVKSCSCACLGVFFCVLTCSRTFSHTVTRTFPSVKSPTEISPDTFIRAFLWKISSRESFPDILLDGCISEPSLENSSRQFPLTYIRPNREQFTPIQIPPRYSPILPAPSWTSQLAVFFVSFPYIYVVFCSSATRAASWWRF